jgi:hypothetical protein
LWAVTLEGFAPSRPPAWMIAFSIVTQVALIAFNLAIWLYTVRSPIGERPVVSDNRIDDSVPRSS